MPCDYVIDKEHRLVVSAAKGIFTAQDALDHADRLKYDPDFSPTLASCSI